MRHHLGADVAAGAGSVLHDDGLAQFSAQLVGDEARRDVGGAAGRVAHDQFDRLAGVGLREGESVAEGCGAQGCGDEQFTTCHACFLLW